MVCDCVVCNRLIEVSSSDGNSHLRGFKIPVNLESYRSQLHEKVYIEAKVWEDGTPIHVIESPAFHHRLRVKFHIGKDSKECFKYGVSYGEEIKYTIFEWPTATLRINVAMRHLLVACTKSNWLSTNIYMVNFVDTLGMDDFVIALYYNKSGAADFNEVAWKLDALKYLCTLQFVQGRIKVIAKLKDRYVVACLNELEINSHIHETGLFPNATLVQSEGSFSNPNGVVTKRVNHWLGSIFDKLGISNAKLLELCSGSGNHTIGLAKYFSKVVSIEIDQKLVERAHENLALNQVKHVTAICDDMKNAQKILKKQADWCDGVFSVVIVDPPRSGLADSTCRFVSELRFDYLIYIACGEGLKRNFKILSENYSLVQLCCADHFPFTHFLEKIAIFKKA